MHILVEVVPIIWDVPRNSKQLGEQRPQATDQNLTFLQHKSLKSLVVFVSQWTQHV